MRAETWQVLNIGKRVPGTVPRVLCGREFGSNWVGLNGFEQRCKREEPPVTFLLAFQVLC